MAGFYDTEAQKLFVIGDADDFGAQKKVTYAHEYVHALQQQHFDIRKLAEGVRGQAEAGAALRALIEGDATIIELQYMFLSLQSEDLQDILQFDENSPVFAGAPYVLRKQMLYPYVAGLSFVGALLQSGDTQVLNESYFDPPVSTEQILHPQKYFDREGPVEVVLPDLPATLGDGWATVDTSTLGEFFLRTYLETQLDALDASAAAEGWGGDTYAIFTGPNQEQMLVVLAAWDTERDAQEFYRVALEPLAGGGNSRYAGISGDETLLVVATDGELIETLLTEMPSFVVG